MRLLFCLVLSRLVLGWAGSSALPLCLSVSKRATDSVPGADAVWRCEAEKIKREN
ncbi:hypothetical protein TRIATDRAFT_254731 [Trichoderma atroviride IMI 206040]|uniref:Uncharacterized protein n=1 Tax=Hypocrea atroviridis (strain ATCC 20476 / IMI 206040) TaxID=452589 RepID=G9NHH4_HYPAI|nr:uncharacterized protein TRIATDRAFT_254731 [Trichoderma atroviride IMI 206040]EHK50068.1 hypothetical protein TRIATDRAFT_254731 [Trichoderma atroviride IMI 206040]